MGSLSWRGRLHPAPEAWHRLLEHRLCPGSVLGPNGLVETIEPSLETCAVGEDRLRRHDAIDADLGHGLLPCEEDLMQALARTARLGVDEIVSQILAEVRAYTHKQKDDVTVVAIKRKAARAPAA